MRISFALSVPVANVFLFLTIVEIKCCVIDKLYQFKIHQVRFI